MDEEKKLKDEELRYGSKEFEKLITIFGFITLSKYVTLFITIVLGVCTIIFWNWYWLSATIFILALYLILLFYSKYLFVKLSTVFEVTPVEKKPIDNSEKPIDYNDLTVNDLKLLLKSEGIPFASSFTKEELIKTILENKID